MTVDKSYVDATYGDHLTVLKAVRHIATLNGAEELIAVEVKITDGNTYTGGMSPVDFGISANGDNPLSNSETTIENGVMAKAHLTPVLSEFSDASTFDGWIPFSVQPANASSLVLVCSIPKAKILGSTKTLPAYTLQVPLFGS